MKNSPSKIFFLVAGATLCLLPLQLLPQLEVGGYQVKRVALLADIVSTESSCSQTEFHDSLPPLPPPPPVSHPKKADGKLPTTVCIEDYSSTTTNGTDLTDSMAHGMRPFYEALACGDSRNRPVRVAYFGDSFIESDIFTSGLRALLQQRFGGEGVGWVDPDAPYAAMRRTVAHRFGGWKTHSVLEHGTYRAALLGLNQRYFTPKRAAWLELRGVDRPGLDSSEVHTLYLRSLYPMKIGVKADNGPMFALPTEGQGRIEALTFHQRASRIRWQIPHDSLLVCWGAAEEGRTGVTVDNFSLRGSSGITLSALTDKALSEWAKVRPYDLLVLQFGLNVANRKQTNYAAYAGHMKQIIERLKRAFPHAGILIVGIGDREDRLTDGELHTIPGVKALLRYQQVMAADCGVAFWNLYEAMGGEGSIRRMAEQHPVEAARDYTHINERGGNRLAEFLFKSMVYGYEAYQREKSAQSGL